MKTKRRPPWTSHGRIRSALRTQLLFLNSKDKKLFKRVKVSCIRCGDLLS
jgi:hypothetical protein